MSGIGNMRFGAVARGLVGASIIGMSATAFSGVAFAQEAAPEENTGLGEIIVTARKVSENLQDVPVAVTVFSGNDLKELSIQKVEDVSSFTPGLSIRQAQSTPSAINITLRGQVQGDILATLDPSVGTYVDGVYWARAYGLNGGFLDINSVQVLKGPQGTLFGRNTTGGALLINSNDPELGEFGGNASLTYGRFNELEATVVTNLALGDKIAIRLAGKRTSRDGYTTNVVPAGTVTGIAANARGVLSRLPFAGTPNGVKLDNRDRWQFRGKVLIQPTDRLSLLFTGEYFDMNEDTPSRELLLATNSFTATNTTYNVGGNSALFVGLLNGGPPPISGANVAAATAIGLPLLNTQIATLAANPNRTANNEVGYATARTHTYNFTGALETDWGQIKLVAGIRDVKTVAGLDLDGSIFPIHFTEGTQDLKQESGELQFTGKAFNDVVDFAAGVFAFHESGVDSSLSIQLGAPLAALGGRALSGATSHNFGIIDNDSIGAYSQATAHISDKFSFTGGFRYSVDDKELETRVNSYDRTSGLTSCGVKPGVTPFNAGGEVYGPAQCGVTRRDSFSGWSYTLGLDYKPTEDILLYIKTAKGFRSGGQNLRAPSLGAFIPFSPEIAYSYEVGFKGEFLDRRVRLNVAAYQTDVSDIQRSSLVAVPPVPPSTVSTTATILSNAGKTRIRGVEADFVAKVTDGLTFSASGALVDPKYIEFRDLSGDRSFERFTGVPKKQFALGADYKGELSENLAFGLHIDYAWRSSIFTNEYNWTPNPQNQAIINATTVNSQGLLSARASIMVNENYELSVFGRNITNNRDFVQKLAVLPLGYIAGIRQEPATYGVTASFKF